VFAAIRKLPSSPLQAAGLSNGVKLKVIHKKLGDSIKSEDEAKGDEGRGRPCKE